MNTFWPYLFSNIFLSMISTIACILLPGLYVTRKVFGKKISALLMAVLALCTGLALFGAQGYLFGWLRLRGFTYLYVMAMDVACLWHWRTIAEYLKDLLEEIRLIPKIIGIVIVCGVLLQTLQMAGNGLPLKTGTSFWRTNGYDGIFHLGLIESMKSTFPPQEPSSSGLAVVNYHYWSDLIISEQSRIFGIAPAFLFFQWTPIIISLFTGMAAYLFVKKLTDHQSSAFAKTAIMVSLLLLFLGSDEGWLLVLYLHKFLSFSYAAIDNGPTQFLNMPHAFGKLFFFVIASLFLYWREKRQTSFLLILVLLTAVTFGLKIYFGIALTLGLALVFISDGLSILFQNRITLKQKGARLLPLVLCGLLFLLCVGAIYLPVNRGAGGLSWYPLEWPKLLINRDNIDWTQLNYKIAIAKYTQNIFKQKYYDLLLIVVGLIAIHGARLLGFLVTRKTFKLFGRDGTLFFLIPVLICTFLGFTTLQDSGGFNVFNFFAVSMSILCVTLALLSAQLVQYKKTLGIVFVTVIIGLCLPRSVYETMTMVDRYRSGYDRVIVTQPDMQAFAYLKAHPNEGIVTTSLEDPLESKSPYIIAFSGRPEYFAGKYLLETHNQPYTEKEQNVRSLFSQNSLTDIKDTAMALGISTILVHKSTGSTPAENLLLEHPDKAVFANTNIFIYDIGSL